MFDPSDSTSWPPHFERNPYLEIASQRLRHDFAFKDIDPSNSDVGRACLAYNSLDPQFYENRTQIATAWSNSLAQYMKSRRSSKHHDQLDTSWWACNTLLVAVMPYIRIARNSSLSWCFDENCPPDPYRCREDELRSVTARECITMNTFEDQGRMLSDPIYEDEVIFEGDSTMADRLSPSQYRYLVSYEVEYGYKAIVGFDNRSKGSIVSKGKSQREFDKASYDWNLLETLLEEELKLQVGSPAFSLRNMKRLAQRSIWEMGIDSETDYPCILCETSYSYHTRLSIVPCTDLQSQFPDYEGSDLEKMVFLPNRVIIDHEAVSKEREEREKVRSNIERRIADRLTRRGFIVIVEPSIVFPFEDAPYPREPDILVVSKGRMIAIEIDDMHHLVVPVARKEEERGGARRVIRRRQDDSVQAEAAIPLRPVVHEPNWRQWQRDRDLDRLLLINGIPIYRISNKDADFDERQNASKIISDIMRIFDSLSG